MVVAAQGATMPPATVQDGAEGGNAVALSLVRAEVAVVADAVAVAVGLAAVGLARAVVAGVAVAVAVPVLLAGVGHAWQKPHKAIGTTIKQLIRQSTVPVIILSGQLVTENATATLGAVDRPAA